MEKRDWIRAATGALRGGGIDAVRIEALARDLGVTKGSFYWHFANLGELREALLSAWEAETLWLVEAAGAADGPEARLVRFFDLVAATDEYPPDVAIFAWARRDAGIARRVHATEERRIGFIAEQIALAGVESAEARRRAEVGYLATSGWIERSGRGGATAADFPTFARHVFRLLLRLPDGADAHRERAALATTETDDASV